ncbi:solute carrier family 35, member F1/2 [Strigomonas culicis]|uniref:Solute carrier family 35, member F1/2 n=1 Tax=Strigomonas culicis TaxID=28005 RepID=S9UVG0_9TRYP|nr:solute carrier family 35, member F1/2 [Strigomonas culicis]EPY32759.1 solute carrier family 35, member F1/2 [Strigomonas culicis]EPY37045.1 solute carrier family 35, member F1/2 [Strigomonas culicis]|eukprot:EPY26273.1 solute carrier family 35, member F1/2 [Strigomonas culicis]
MGGNCSHCNPTAVKEIFKRIFLGQAIAFLNSLTGVFTTKLVNNNASYPVLQSVTAYVFILTVYMPLYLFFLYKFRNTKFSNYRFLNHWWKYIILAVVDLEANYCAVYAYQFTDMLSVQLLNCFTIPCVLVLSFFLLKMKFAMTHILGCIIAVGGMALLIGFDADGVSRSDKGAKPVLGDMLALISAALYATSNVLTEWFVKPKKSKGLIEILNDPTDEYAEELNEGPDEPVEGNGGKPKKCRVGVEPTAMDERSVERRAESGESETNHTGSGNGTVVKSRQRDGEGFVEGETVGEDEVEELPRVPVYIPVIENLAMMSLFATLFAIIQFFAAEWKTFKPERENWTDMDWLFQLLFGLTMLLLYTGMPALFIVSSAAFANISMLAMNVYSIIWNVAFFKIYPTSLFFAAYVIIIVGTVIFNLSDVFTIPFCTRFNYPCGKPSTLK